MVCDFENAHNYALISLENLKYLFRFHLQVLSPAAWCQHIKGQNWTCRMSRSSSMWFQNWIVLNSLVIYKIIYTSWVPVRLKENLHFVEYDIEEIRTADIAPTSVSFLLVWSFSNFISEEFLWTINSFFILSSKRLVRLWTITILDFLMRFSYVLYLHMHLC